MAESAYLEGRANRTAELVDSPRHSAIVRVTHWINALSFAGLLISGVAILLAHPRFYWGETGGMGVPSVLDLPLPFMKGGPSGWGRNLHFLSAWVGVLNGLLYVLSGFLTQHFRKDLLPAERERTGAETNLAYSLIQRLTYLGVVFGLFPLIIWTGFAMSPAITSVFPAVVNVLGGQQTARTLHFFAADFLVLFLLVHIAMVWAAGFTSRVQAMITGHGAPGKDRA